MIKFSVMLGCCLSVCALAYGQSPSFQTYINPIIPGDHPDPTLTKIGKDFYTSGSSFNPTPKIYHSTDLVHWEVIAQPVSATWSSYGDSPGGGIWGGHMVLYNGFYWHFFGLPGQMHFVKASDPKGPWSTPTLIFEPAGVPGLGQDNSIFIDDNNRWYMLVKNGQENNWIVELGPDGKPAGDVLDLTWLNPNTEGNPYGWAEGPVMWKYNGYYYYSFAQHLSGEQYVMRSETLTDDESEWTIKEGTIFTGSRGVFGTPNHISPVVMLDDGTSWTIAHSNHSSSWHAQGRQGLLCQVTYDDQDFPVIQYPSSNAVEAPVLSSSGIPWTVPKSDMFNSSELKPEWSFLGYTPDGTYSLTDREGWLYLEPYQGSNTVIQNDGEHGYALITRVDFDPVSVSDEAGLWIMNGPETHHAKVFSTVNNEDENVLAFRFEDTLYEVENPIGSIVWLKLVRNNNMISGYYSADGMAWIRIGEAIDAQILDTEKPDYNKFTGNQQGLYIEGKSAYFDLYIYRDAYTPMLAECPANQYGTSRAYSNQGYVLDNIHANDWAMAAGVEFGNTDYDKIPDSLKVIASSNTTGGSVEVWLDSLDTGDKIAECPISNTGGWKTFQTFATAVTSAAGRHDVYLKFTGTGDDKLFQLQSFWFTAEGDTSTVSKPSDPNIPQRFGLEQNFPNPFNPRTTIQFALQKASTACLEIYDLIGRSVATLVNKKLEAGYHAIDFNASNLASGVYFCSLKAGGFSSVKKIIIIK